MGRIVLDTGVLWDPALLRSLGAVQEDLVLPAVAFTERARQVLRSGRSLQELWALLEAGDVVVEPFLSEHGLRFAANLDDGLWRRHARDALIAGHVGPDDLLWTKNPKDFLALGLPAVQVVAV